jgi:hypothetical protein
VPDLDDLTPTEHLVLNVLAARYRLGEGGWSFPRGQGMARILNGLANRGLVGWKSGPAGDYFTWLTDEGKAECLVDGYMSPLERLRQAAIKAGAIRHDYPAGAAVDVATAHLATCLEARRA